MKKFCKILALALAVLMMLSALSACSSSRKNGSEGDDGEMPAHVCQNVCAVCLKCKNRSCSMRVCDEKCACDSSLKDAAYSYFPLIGEEMPAIHINTADGKNDWATMYIRYSKLMGHIDYVDATVSTERCEDAYLLSDLDAEVKVRGNYTLDYEKKPIRIKFKEKSNLLGLHDGEAYKNWVLLADWKDLSLLNNTVAFYLGNTILGSDGYYCTDFRHVEVYLNGVYWGVYLLAEQQEVKGERVGVPEVPKGYTGNDIGYFFEYDAYYDLENVMPDGDPTFVMNYMGIPAATQGYTVKSDIHTKSQIDFLQNYMNNTFYIAYQAIALNQYYKFNSDYSDIELAPEYTDAKEAVGAVIDLQSLVDVYILNEIACDLDVDWSSFYLSLDMTESGNKKVTFEAPWDFDSCFGIIHKRNCSNPEGLFAATSENPWYRLVVQEDWFEEMVWEKWAELKAYGVMDNAIELIEIEKEYFADYYIKNHQRWSARVVHGNGEVVEQLNTYNNTETAQALAADYLKDWLTRRFAYLDSQWRE